MLAATIVLGLASRAYRQVLPVFIGEYAGDTLYAVMIYVLICMWSPAVSPRRAVLLTGVLCCLIELSQLCQADWLNAIRHTRLGGLVLGFGFLWSDLACYVCGALLAGWADHRWSANRYNIVCAPASNPDIMMSK